MIGRRKQKITSAAEVKPPLTKAVRNVIKRKILTRDQVCQYREKASGKMCGSRWNLEIDHSQPRWAHGSNEEDNLRLLCRKHNQHVYRKQVGISRLSKFVFEKSKMFHFDKILTSSRQNP